MMKGKFMFRKLILALVVLWWTGLVRAQAPDLIVVNAKIVPMSDAGFNTNTGTIAEAMAIRGGRIVAVGNTAQIRAMGNSNTRVMDLKGRMVLPGFIISHDHPSDWDMTNPYLVKKVIPEDVIIHVFTEGSAEQQLQQMEQGIRDAVRRAKPGQWIRGVISFGREYDVYRSIQPAVTGGGTGMRQTDRDVRVSKAHLDEIAPNNPVMIRSSFTGTTYNTKAKEVIEAFQAAANPITWNKAQINDKGGDNVVGYRYVEGEILLGDHHNLLVELERIGLPWWAGYGISTVNTSVYTPNWLRTYKELDHQGQMAIRFSWLWGWSFDYKNAYLVSDIATRVGEGSDYFWFNGLGEGWGIGSGCTTLKPIREGVNQGTCAVVPGKDLYESMYAVIKAGGRLSGFHMGGDLDVDSILDLIEKASREGGLTEEQIRSKRHGIDHAYGYPRPDQAQRMARLGMVSGMTNFSIFETPPQQFEDYGEAILNQIVPRKTAVNAHLMNSFEMDRPLATTNWNVFDVLARSVNRKAWDGKQYAVNQALDRVMALKTGTIWGAYYLLKEKDLGSLETGKFADFMVIDKDYLTIPENQLDQVNVLMTVVGGKVVHLVPSLARELGLQPAGTQVELGSPTVQLIP